MRCESLACPNLRPVRKPDARLLVQLCWLQCESLADSKLHPFQKPDARLLVQLCWMWHESLVAPKLHPDRISVAWFALQQLQVRVRYHCAAFGRARENDRIGFFPKKAQQPLPSSVPFGKLFGRSRVGALGMVSLMLDEKAPVGGDFAATAANPFASVVLPLWLAASVGCEDPVRLFLVVSADV